MICFRLRSGLLSVCLLVIVGAAHRASAHVVINTPNGGESLTVGATQVIEWEPAVAPHDTQRFEVFYSTVSADGPWTSIAGNVPPGNLAIGSLHTFSWTVPSVTDSSAWIRVRQENNVDADYEDVSDGSFAIAAAAGLVGDYNNNLIVDAADYSIWRNSLGRQGAGLAADGNGDNRVDSADYTLWKSNFGDTSGAGSAALASSVVPEPRLCLLLAALALGWPKYRGNRPSRSRGIAG